jgi:hypothetical protein
MSAKIYVGSVCVFVPVIVRAPPEREAKLIVVKNAVYRNLSWNTTDETLRQVSLVLERARFFFFFFLYAL